MGAVLGLSLTADEVTWALVDTSDRTVVDHDTLECDADGGIAGAAARGAHALAMATGLNVERVRMVWTPDATTCSTRLQARLHELGFQPEAVPLTCATRVLIDPSQGDMPSLVALAYGAALAEVDPAEAITVTLARQAPQTHRRRPAPYVAAGLGVAAAAAVAAVFFVHAGSVPQIEPAANAAAQSDPGWVSVTAPAAAADPLRKVVTESSSPESAQPAVPDAIAYAAPVPQPAPAAAAPHPEPTAVPMVTAVAAAPAGPVTEAAPLAAAPVPDAVPAAEAAVAAPAAEAVVAAPAAEAVVAAPAAEADQQHLPAVDQQHLPGAAPLVAPLPGPEAPAAPAPGPDMTDPANLFTAVP